jgi:nitroreductase/NAD-dependent dihydropyrimidine dehydrogenase PreA subunit
MRPQRLDPDRCDLCGLCEEICGRGFFEEHDEEMIYIPTEECIACGHCMAVCPSDALVRADGSLPAEIDQAMMPSPDVLLHFLRARRSTRRFKPEVPEREKLKRLIEAAQYAPTGTNKQDVRIVMVTDSARIDTLRIRIMTRYGEYGHHLKNPVKRFFLKTFVDKRLGNPTLRAYLESFLKRYHDGGDPLFHNAPVIVFLYTGKDTSTPKDDCCIALYHMVLMAERLGLGSCLLGTAEAAFARTPALNEILKIPRDHQVRAAACFGYPTVEFKRLTDRKTIPVTWL